MHKKSANEKTKNKILKKGNIWICVFLRRLLFGDIKFSGFVYFVVKPVVFFMKLTSLFRTFKSGDKDVT